MAEEWTDDWFKEQIKQLKNLREEQKSYYSELEGYSKIRIVTGKHYKIFRCIIELFQT